MCLDTVTQIYEKRSAKVQYGWKALQCTTVVKWTKHARPRAKFNKIFQTPFRSLARGERTIQSGRWYQSVEVPILTKNYALYPSGFHIFKNKAQVKKWIARLVGCDVIFSSTGLVVAKIKYKSVKCTGTQNGLPVIVVDKILVITKPK